MIEKTLPFYGPIYSLMEPISYELGLMKLHCISDRMHRKKPIQNWRVCFCKSNQILEDRYYLVFWYIKKNQLYEYYTDMNTAQGKRTTQKLTKESQNSFEGPLLYLWDLSNLHQDLVQRLRFREEGAVVAAFDLENTFRRVLSDQLLLDIGREGMVVECLYVEAATSSILLSRQGELLHYRSQRDGSHRNHSQSNILKRTSKTNLSYSELEIHQERSLVQWHHLDLRWRHASLDSQ